MCIDNGFNKSSGTKWKNGSVPDITTLNKISDYFNVPTSYFLGKDEKNTDNDLKFALFNGSDNITDEMFEEVKNFAKYVQQRETEKNGHK